MCINGMLNTGNEMNTAHSLQILNLVKFNPFYDHDGHEYDIWMYIKYFKVRRFHT